MEQLVQGKKFKASQTHINSQGFLVEPLKLVSPIAFAALIFQKLSERTAKTSRWRFPGSFTFADPQLHSGSSWRLPRLQKLVESAKSADDMN